MHSVSRKAVQIGVTSSASLLAVATTTAALAQDSMQRRGVSYWGQPAAQRLYAPQPAARTATPQQLGRQQMAYPARAAQPASAAAKPQQSLAGSTFNLEVVSQGVRRTSIVHIPKTYDPRRPAPVILCFHGLSMSAYQMPPYTGMNAAADATGFIVIYPDSSGGRWDDGFSGPDHGDIEFIEKLIATLPTAVSADTRRIYSCGISNGGFFSERLACEMGNKLSGIGVVAATGYRKVLAPCTSPSVPVILFMGTEDNLIPYDSSKSIKTAGRIAAALGFDTGGTEISGAITQMGGLYSAADAVDYWVKRNGANPSPRTTTFPHRSKDNCRVTLQQYGGGRGEVDFYTIENGGHTWPGAFPIPTQLGATTQDIDASRLMCEFFKSH